MSGLATPPPIKGAEKPTDKTGCGGCLLFLAIPIGLIAVLVFIGSIFSGESDPADEQRGLARIYCERAVEQRLLSPSTARFSHDRTVGSNPFEVRGQVDSQNGFGATVRTGYGCTVTFTGDRYSVTVDYLL